MRRRASHCYCTTDCEFWAGCPCIPRRGNDYDVVRLGTATFGAGSSAYLPDRALAAVRLLTMLQVAFWGHPVTTGSDAIDYFVGSQWFLPMEYRVPIGSEPMQRLPPLGKFGLMTMNAAGDIGGVPLCSSDIGLYGFMERWHVCMRSIRLVISAKCVALRQLMSFILFAQHVVPAPSAPEQRRHGYSAALAGRRRHRTEAAILFRSAG